MAFVVTATTQTTSYAATLDCAGGTLLLVFVCMQNADNPPTSVTYGSSVATQQTLTQLTGIGGTSTNDGTGNVVYYLLNPQSGSNSLNLVGGSPGATVTSLMALTGNHPTAPFGAKGTTLNTGSVSSVALTLASVVGSTSFLMFAEQCLYSTTSGGTVTSGWTASPSPSIAGYGEVRPYYLASPVAGSNTLTFTSTNSVDLNMLGVELLPGPPSSTITVDSLLSSFQLGSISSFTRFFDQTVGVLSAFATFSIGSATVIDPALPVIVAIPLIMTALPNSTAIVRADPKPQSLTAGSLLITTIVFPVTVKEGVGLTVPLGYMVATFTVVLSTPAIEPSSVGWITDDKTAIGGQHYVISGGAVQFKVGQSVGAFQVLINIPAPGAPSREFEVILSAPSGVDITGRTATATIPAGVPVTVVVGSPTPAGLSVAPLVVSFVLPSVQVIRGLPPIPLTAGPQTATFTLGSSSVVVPQPPVLTIAGVGDTFSIGGVTLVVFPVVKISSLTLMVTLGAITTIVPQSIRGSSVTATYTLGNVTLMST
jgi:hypothetical protein